MGAYGSVENDTVAYGSGTWIHTHDAWVLRERHVMVHMLLTGRTVLVYQGGRSWLEVDRKGHRYSKGMDCDIWLKA
jgi:hypothetical protein